MSFASHSLMWGIDRHGLIIGLGEYKDKTWGKIHGDKDIPIVKEMLKECGYSDIVTLSNNKATKSGIIAAFSCLTDRCQSGDIVYIHFSGHGQQITDVNGDEDDGWDEAWIPYDAMYAYSATYKGEKHLIDDEIAKLLDAVRKKVGKNGKILVVVDACHSGDSDRASFDEDEYIRGASHDFKIPLNTSPKKTKKAGGDWLTVTACKNVQNNCEVKVADGVFHGILSYALYSEFARLSKLDNNKCVSEIQRFVNLNRKRGKQTVTLSGNHSLAQFFK